MIIYPPLIGDMIPGFTTTEIKIPFSHSPTVSKENEVKGFALLIKDYMTSKVQATLIVDNRIDEMINNSEAVFTLDPADKESWKPTTAQYYKFQLSYLDGTEDETELSFMVAWSTAAIGRCIGAKKNNNISILGMDGMTLKPDILNISSLQFTGVYKSNIVSEAVYKYRFYIENDETKEIVQDTGELIHDATLDTVQTGIVSSTRTMKENFKVRYELEEWQYYNIVFTITTVNGFQDSISYPIIKAGYLPSMFFGEVIAEQDSLARDNGYVNISLKYYDKPVKGKFELLRTQDGKTWDTLTKFKLTKISDLNNFTWKDWSVEQGVKYIYAIQQYSGNSYSERIESQPIIVDFEHMFLSDGQRQLKIAFNPKVSSFKNTILESKSDTIGSRYPFFFRNGNVKYKEIPISGLISYLMDDNKLFMTDEELNLFNANFSREQQNEMLVEEENHNRNYYSTNLTNNNIGIERKFKLAVLEWLTNGEFKLFRSPTEGNYIVRLLNTSLSPNDTLGRMLHTFSSTAYEAAAADIETILKNNLVNLPELQDPAPSHIYQTFKFSDLPYTKGKCELFNGDNMVAGTISNILWHSERPSLTYGIEINDGIDNKVYYNTTGIFTTPEEVMFNNIIITQPTEENIENYGDTITISYIPNLSTEEGEDEFEDLVLDSDNILFSVPSGSTLREDEPLLLVEEKEGTTKVHNIYNTYVLVVRKDPNYEAGKNSEEFNLFFWEDYEGTDRSLANNITTIDCSDGIPRYYYNINQHTLYEKGKGLHVDIYARVGGVKTLLSSELGKFILGSSKLGG